MTPCESTPRRLAKMRFSAVSRAASGDRPNFWKHAAQNAASGSAVTFISFIRWPRGFGVGVLYSLRRTRCKAGLGLRVGAGWLKPGAQGPLFAGLRAVSGGAPTTRHRPQRSMANLPLNGGQRLFV